MPYLTIPSGRVFYKDYAPTNGSRRATLLLHNGLGSTHCFYHPIAALLTSPGHSYRLISYDCISSGLSTLSKSPQTIHTLAADAEAVLDALGVKEKVIFVGHSLGGVVAAVLAATREDWACAAVMLGPILPSDSMTDLAEARIEAVERKGMESMADTLPMGATGRTATPTQRAFIRTLLLSQKPEGYVKMCQVIVCALSELCLRFSCLFRATEYKGRPE